VEKSLVEKSLVEKSLVEKSLVEKSLVEKSLVEKSLVEKSLVEKSLVEKSLVEKSLAKGALAIVQRWNVGCEHRLTVGKGRVDNSENSFLDLLYLVTKVHREVVVPRFACILG
jgi:hypothetical protein